MAARPKKIRLLSPAKLNLGLWIVGRRRDGLHRLESLFWPIDLVDEIEVETGADRPGIFMEWAGDSPVRMPLPLETENIVGKIRKVFPSALGKDVAIRIQKRIPLGGGLGGGSSNAGTLIARFAKDTPDLEAKAAEVGADVPFFLNTFPTWVTGIGDKRRVLEFSVDSLKSVHFLVVCLPEPTLTSRVFGALKESNFAFSPPRNPFPTKAVRREALFNYLEWARNDLEAFAAKDYPLIGEVLSALRKTSCLFAGMSGSGSTCFAIFDDTLDREKSAKELSSFFRERGCTSLFVETYKAHRVIHRSRSTSWKSPKSKSSPSTKISLRRTSPSSSTTASSSEILKSSTETPASS